MLKPHAVMVIYVLITDAKVIYYIGTAIRANGDLQSILVFLHCLIRYLNKFTTELVNNLVVVNIVL